MVCGMELRHFLEKLEVSGSFFASLCFKAERKCQMKAKYHTNFQPDRVLSYFQKEWKVLLAVTISGLIYNIGLLAGPWFEGKMTGCLVDILKGAPPGLGRGRAWKNRNGADFH